jgi:hypothetical protein
MPTGIRIRIRKKKYDVLETLIPRNKETRPGREKDSQTKEKTNGPANSTRFRKRWISDVASFTQAKCVGDALKQKAG